MPPCPPTPRPRWWYDARWPGLLLPSERSWCSGTSTTSRSGEQAVILGVSIGTVKSQNAAALARLRTGAPELLDLTGRTYMNSRSFMDWAGRHVGPGHGPDQRPAAGSEGAGRGAPPAALPHRGARGRRSRRGRGDRHRRRSTPGTRRQQPPSGPNTPSVTPSATADTETPGPLNAVQPRWDPFTIEDEPFHPTTLPANLAPPAAAPSVADEPMTAAVIAWPEEGQDLDCWGPTATGARYRARQQR